MKRHLLVNLAVLAALVPFVAAPSGFGQTGERHSLTRETIKLTGKSGSINLFLEMPPNRANAPAANRLKINLFLENGKISLIGENGSVCGIIGDSGRPFLMIGTQVIGLYDGSGKRVGGIDADGNIRLIIGDSGRLVLTGVYGREIAYIGENGILTFQK